ncbi:MAG: D-glycero-beta-D-manno-heptose 1,7-bisphosphate 7-phosphatase [Deltaproteobacteria bacterium]|nr:D-glycero-beta-D-manno-heptose 1,7-bisphosphate 7-phosphatase [Deltaproteobacteria bacterium]
MKNAAVFLDRDGTINEEVKYLSRLEQLNLFPFTFEAIRMINESGMKVVLITNQSGVARGFFNEDFLDTVHVRINELLGEKGAHIDRFYYCPHHPIYGKGPYKVDCDCRKPKPGMIMKAMEELQIDPARSYIIGDMVRDLQTGHNAGIKKAILVKTGYGENIVQADMATYVANNILDAVTWIMKDREQ